MSSDIRNLKNKTRTLFKNQGTKIVFSRDDSLSIEKPSGFKIKTVVSTIPESYAVYVRRDIVENPFFMEFVCLYYEYMANRSSKSFLEIILVKSSTPGDRHETVFEKINPENTLTELEKAIYREEKRQELKSKIIQTANSMQEKDPTMRCYKNTFGISTFDFYFQGYEGNLEFDYQNELFIMKIKDNIVKMKTITTEKIVHFFEEIGKKQRLENLLNPPRKNFDQTFWDLDRTDRDYIFNTLKKQTHPSEIEKQFAISGAKMRGSFIKNNGVQLFSVFDSLFVVNNEQPFITDGKVEDMQKMIETFEEQMLINIRNEMKDLYKKFEEQVKEKTKDRR